MQAPLASLFTSLRWCSFSARLPRPTLLSFLMNSRYSLWTGTPSCNPSLSPILSQLYQDQRVCCLGLVLFSCVILHSFLEIGRYPALVWQAN